MVAREANVRLTWEEIPKIPEGQGAQSWRACHHPRLHPQNPAHGPYSAPWWLGRDAWPRLRAKVG